ncbi:hypothetical protein D3C81_1495930 [compost metagenome]
MHGHGKAVAVFAHQLVQVLPGQAQHLRHVGQAHEVGRGLDQHGLGHDGLDVGQGAEQRLPGIAGLAREFQRQASRLTDADQGVVATAAAQAPGQRVEVVFVVGQAVLESEDVIPDGYPLDLRCMQSCISLLKVPLSTTRRIARAWLPGFFGVLQMQAMQNSPQRQPSSL